MGFWKKHQYLVVFLVLNGTNEGPTPISCRAAQAKDLPGNGFVPCCCHVSKDVAGRLSATMFAIDYNALCVFYLYIYMCALYAIFFRQAIHVGVTPEAQFVCAAWAKDVWIQIYGGRNREPWCQQKCGNLMGLEANKMQVWYCWWKKSCTTWDVSNLVNNGINYVSTGAGFLPSIV